jgi:heat shock protein HslJ
MSRGQTVSRVALVAGVFLALSGGLAGARTFQAHAHTSATSRPARGVTQPPSATSAIIPLRTLKLVSFTYNGNPQALVRGATITLRFDPSAHALGGRAGCNEYGGYYTLSGGRLRLDGPGYTQMRCLSDRVMAQEARYLEAFARVTTYHLDQSGLILSDASGAYVLRFE